MKYQHTFLWIITPLLLATAAGVFTSNAVIGIAVGALLLMPAVIAIYIPYAKDNPNHYWFKRKLFGWGWTPVTWEGWLVTVLYIGLLIGFAGTIDERSSGREIVFTFGLPAVLLTLTFVRIAYKKGESPRWQWGADKK